MAEKDYRPSSLIMEYNSSREELVSTASIGNESVIFQGEPKISLELMEELFPILPMRSSFALDDSMRNSSELYLVTEYEWEPGKYILTCGVYSNHNLSGIRQKKIELVS